MLPVPNQRTLWPNFQSPLMFDVVAISTYLTVSSLFWYTGMLPDLATIRDRAVGVRKKIFTVLALGWTGEFEIWRHYTRGYLFFAALATPLVISVHSVVSWDFALSVVPGWHTTIFAPYFVAGAIHSGLAMVVTLMIPLRIIFRYQAIITDRVLESVAKTIIFTGLIVGFAYATEIFIAWYSHNPVEVESFRWRAFGDYALEYWIMVSCNVLIPLLLFFKRDPYQYPHPLRYLVAGQRGHVVRALRDHHRVRGPRLSAPCLGPVHPQLGRIRHHDRQLLPVLFFLCSLCQTHALGLHDRDERNPCGRSLP